MGTGFCISWPNLWQSQRSGNRRRADRLLWKDDEDQQTGTLPLVSDMR
jgi:hypothetical protein